MFYVLFSYFKQQKIVETFSTFDLSVRRFTVISNNISRQICMDVFNVTFSMHVASAMYLLYGKTHYSNIP